jgi:hypothetical protein
MKPRVRAQLHSSSGRSSKLLKDPEGSEDPSRDLLAVGVVHAEGIVAIHPEELSAVDGEQGAPRPGRSPNV